MPRFICFIPITLILHACGGGNIEEPIIETPNSVITQTISTLPPTNTPTNTPTNKTTMPVNCTIIQGQCI